VPPASASVVAWTPPDEAEPQAVAQRDAAQTSPHHARYCIALLVPAVL
jgi:hypothetical protein